MKLLKFLPSTRMPAHIKEPLLAPGQDAEPASAHSEPTAKAPKKSDAHRCKSFCIRCFCAILGCGAVFVYHVYVQPATPEYMNSFCRSEIETMARSLHDAKTLMRNPRPNTSTDEQCRTWVAVKHSLENIVHASNGMKTWTPQGTLCGLSHSVVDFHHGLIAIDSNIQQFALDISLFCTKLIPFETVSRDWRDFVVTTHRFIQSTRVFRPGHHAFAFLMTTTTLVRPRDASCAYQRTAASWKKGLMDGLQSKRAFRDGPSVFSEVETSQSCSTYIGGVEQSHWSSSQKTLVIKSFDDMFREFHTQTFNFSSNADLEHFYDASAKKYAARSNSPTTTNNLLEIAGKGVTTVGGGSGTMVGVGAGLDALGEAGIYYTLDELAAISITLVAGEFIGAAVVSGAIGVGIGYGMSALAGAAITWFGHAGFFGRSADVTEALSRSLASLSQDFVKVDHDATLIIQSLKQCAQVVNMLGEHQGSETSLLMENQIVMGVSTVVSELNWIHEDFNTAIRDAFEVKYKYDESHRAWEQCSFWCQSEPRKPVPDNILQVLSTIQGHFDGIGISMSNFAACALPGSCTLPYQHRLFQSIHQLYHNAEAEVKHLEDTVANMSP